MKLDEKYLTLSTDSLEEVYNYLIDVVWDVVIYENFSSGGLISGYGQETIRIIGGIQAIAYLKKYKLVKQPPQRRLSFVREAYKHPHLVVHEVDALAHLLAWEHKNAIQNKGV